MIKTSWMSRVMAKEVWLKAKKEQVVEAALDLANPDKDEDRAWARLRTAWRRYVARRVAKNTVHKQADTP